MNIPNKININICLLNDDEQEISLFFTKSNIDNSELITKIIIKREKYENNKNYLIFKELYNIYTLLDDEKLQLISGYDKIKLLDIDNYLKGNKDKLEYINKKIELLKISNIIQDKELIRTLNIHSLNDHIKNLIGELNKQTNKLSNKNK